MKKAVFLDRDGTVIRDMIYLNDPAKIEIFPEAYEAIRLLNEHQFLVIVVTNQSGVARGIVEEAILKQINSLLVSEFERREAHISEVLYCPHPVDGGCECRKPNAGMLTDSAHKWKIDLAQSWMVGDRMSDVEAGRRAGCRSILLKNETTPSIDAVHAEAEIVVRDILEAARIIVSG